MKAYIGKKSFSGACSDNLNNYLKTYGTLSAMCNLASDFMLNDLTIMLTGYAFDYFSQNSQKCSTYE